MKVRPELIGFVVDTGRYTPCAVGTYSIQSGRGSPRASPCRCSGRPDEPFVSPWCAARTTSLTHRHGASALSDFRSGRSLTCGHRHVHSGRGGGEACAASPSVNPCLVSHLDARESFRRHFESLSTRPAAGNLRSNPSGGAAESLPARSSARIRLLESLQGSHSNPLREPMKY